MAHRGRLNVLANIMGKSPADIFAEFEDIDPESMFGGGDVKYHLGFSTRPRDRAGQQDPPDADAQPQPPRGRRPGGRRARARQAAPARRRRRAHGACSRPDPRRRRVRRPGPGRRDAQPVAAPGYRTGGTIHVVVNNQIGFTTVAGGRPLDALLHRRRQDDPGADLPRQRRGPRGGGATSAELALDFRQSSSRTSSSTCTATASTATTRATSRRSPSRSCTRRSSSSRRCAKLYTEQLVERGDLAQRRPRPSSSASIRSSTRRSRRSGRRGREPACRLPGCGRATRRHRRGEPEVDDRRVARELGELTDRITRAARRVSGRTRRSRSFFGQARADGARRASRSTGRLAETWRSARCCGGHIGASVGAGHPARHLQPAPRGPGRQTHGAGVRAARAHVARTRRRSHLRLACSRRRRCSASSSATRSTSPTCW